MTTLLTRKYSELSWRVPNTALGEQSKGWHLVSRSLVSPHRSGCEVARLGSPSGEHSV